MQPITVLIVESLAIIATHIEDILLDSGVGSSVYIDPDDAVHALQAGADKSAIVVLGTNLDGGALDAFSDAVAGLGLGLIILSTRAEAISAAVRSRGAIVLDKPFNDEELLRSINHFRSC